MPTTPTFGLPYPAGADAFTPRADLAALALRADDALAPVARNVEQLMDQPLLVLRADIMTVPHATNTAVIWDAAVRDTHRMWTPEVPDHITIPTAGIWSIVAFIGWAANGSGHRSAWLARGGTDRLAEVAGAVHSSLTVNGQNLAIERDLAAGDALQLMLWQTSGELLSAAAVPMYLTVRRLAR